MLFCLVLLAACGRVVHRYARWDGDCGRPGWEHGFLEGHGGRDHLTIHMLGGLKTRLTDWVESSGVEYISRVSVNSVRHGRWFVESELGSQIHTLGQVIISSVIK